MRRNSPLPLSDHLRRDVDHVVEHVAHFRGAERGHEKAVWWFPSVETGSSSAHSWLIQHTEKQPTRDAPVLFMVVCLRIHRYSHNQPQPTTGLVTKRTTYRKQAIAGAIADLDEGGGNGLGKALLVRELVLELVRVGEDRRPGCGRAGRSVSVSG